jgi:hypothetical protein
MLGSDQDTRKNGHVKEVLACVIKYEFATSINVEPGMTSFQITEAAKFIRFAVHKCISSE